MAKVERRKHTKGFPVRLLSLNVSEEEVKTPSWLLDREILGFSMDLLFDERAVESFCSVS